MHGFISGRNAITNNDANEKNIAISEVRAAWRKVVASTAIHYLNGSVEDFSDDALRCHQLSEAIAFIRSLKYNEEAGVSTETIEAWTNRIGDNLYEVTIADLNFVRDQISDTYGFNDVKSTL